MMTSSTGSDPEIVVGFLLLPEFPLMSYAAAVEPLRAANQIAGRRLYRWWHASPGDTTVAASNGITVQPDVKIGAAEPVASRVFICAGANPSVFTDRPTFAWLRGLARRGIAIGGISGGPWAMARAGLLDNRRCTLHWEHIPAFCEQFPRVEVARSLFEIDRDRITCSGGIAALDLMLALIASDHGSTLATQVAEWFLHNRIREGLSPQRMATTLRFQVRDTRLIRVLDAIEANLETPLTREVLAAIACVSPRQLERMVRAALGCGLHRHYLQQRLSLAQRLERETSMPLKEIAVAAGFVSAAELRRARRRLTSRESPSS